MTVSRPSRRREKARCTSARVESVPSKAVLIAEPFPGGDEAGEPRAEFGVGELTRGRVSIGRVFPEHGLGAPLSYQEAQRDLVHEMAAIQVQRLGRRQR